MQCKSSLAYHSLSVCILVWLKEIPKRSSKLNRTASWWNYFCSHLWNLLRMLYSGLKENFLEFFLYTFIDLWVDFFPSILELFYLLRSLMWYFVELSQSLIVILYALFKGHFVYFSHNRFNIALYIIFHSFYLSQRLRTNSLFFRSFVFMLLFDFLDATQSKCSLLFNQIFNMIHVSNKSALHTIQ